MSTPRVWLVTGCSSGFGEEFVRQIVARGDKVIATGRNVSSKLKHLESTGATILELDIAASEASIAATIKKAVSAHGRIDILVNNAGFTTLATTEEVTQEQLQKGFGVNLFGHVNVTRAVLPYMRQQRSGTICFIGSMMGWTGMATSIAYSGPKFAQESVAECLTEELQAIGQTDIRTIVVEPGTFRTHLLGDNALKGSSQIEDYRQMNEMFSRILPKFSGNQLGDVKKGVAVVIDVLTGTGAAKGKPLPPRLPLGSDALETIRKKCQETLKICDEWEDLIKSTDIPGAPPMESFFAE